MNYIDKYINNRILYDTIIKRRLKFNNQKETLKYKILFSLYYIKIIILIDLLFFFRKKAINDTCWTIFKVI